MKKINIRNYFVFLIIIILAILFTVKIFAYNDAINWYCVHRKDHKQPTVGSDLSFVESYNGYYIDKKHGDGCEDKVVYLTFDAGYENGNVERILDTLKAEEVKGAFFVLGNLIEKNPDLISRMFDEGHLVCNHTYSHKTMVGRTQEEISAELSKLEKTCLEKTGRTMSKYYRPPEGKFDETSIKIIDDLGYKTIFWSFAYADWDNDRQMSCENAKKKILENVHNGEIILLHPTSATNAEILGEIISNLKSQGYRFGTLDELCSISG